MQQPRQRWRPAPPTRLGRPCGRPAVAPLGPGSSTGGQQCGRRACTQQMPTSRLQASLKLPRRHPRRPHDPSGLVAADGPPAGPRCWPPGRRGPGGSAPPRGRFSQCDHTGCPCCASLAGAGPVTDSTWEELVLKSPVPVLVSVVGVDGLGGARCRRRRARRDLRCSSIVVATQPAGARQSCAVGVPTAVGARWHAVGSASGAHQSGWPWLSDHARPCAGVGVPGRPAAAARRQQARRQGHQPRSPLRPRAQPLPTRTHPRRCCPLRSARLLSLFSHASLARAPPTTTHTPQTYSNPDLNLKT